MGPLDNDLILNYAKDGEAIGPRIIVHGQVLDQNGRGVQHVLIEFWQANSGGRYRRRNDNYIAPINPHFGGCGPYDNRRNGLFLLSYHQARPLPVAQLRQ